LGCDSSVYKGELLYKLAFQEILARPDTSLEGRRQVDLHGEGSAAARSSLDGGSGVSWSIYLAFTLRLILLSHSGKQVCEARALQSQLGQLVFVESPTYSVGVLWWIPFSSFVSWLIVVMRANRRRRAYSVRSRMASTPSSSPGLSQLGIGKVIVASVTKSTA